MAGLTLAAPPAQFVELPLLALGEADQLARTPPARQSSNQAVKRERHQAPTTKPILNANQAAISGQMPTTISCKAVTVSPRANILVMPKGLGIEDPAVLSFNACDRRLELLGDAAWQRLGRRTLRRG